MDNQLLVGTLEKTLNKIHNTTGTIQPFQGGTIFKYVSPIKTTVIKVLNPEERDVDAYINKVHPRIKDLYKKLNFPRNIARINGDPIKFGNMHVLEMTDLGTSLKKVLEETKKPFDFHTILDYSLQIALGLAQLQYCGINHRDVKPSNVIVVGNDLKIIDFDISRTIKTDTSTKTGTKLQLTFQYACPKRLNEGQNQNSGDIIGEKKQNTWFRDDAYSLGLVILELICHGYPDLQKAFKGFVNNENKKIKKFFNKFCSAIIGQIANFIDLGDPIMANLIFLVTQLVRFQSIDNIDLMAAYKFLKLIELKKLPNEGIAKQFIKEQVERSAQRLNGKACEAHENQYSYIYFPIRPVKPADTVKAKMATFTDTKQKIVVVDTQKKEKTQIDVRQYNFGTGTRLVSTGDGCFMMGGEDSSNGDTLDINLKCEFSNLTLHKKAKIPDDGRSSSGIAFSPAHNLIVLVGGFRKNSNIAKKIPAYDPLKNEWRARAETLNERVCPACCFSKQYLYIFGGMSTQESDTVRNCKKIERIQSKHLFSEAVACSEEVKLKVESKDLDQLLASCDALSVCIKEQQILILGGANELLTDQLKDGYLIDFKEKSFKEIKEPNAFSKTSFYTPGEWVDGNFLVPKPGASGKGDLYQGKFDNVKGEIEFTEIDHKEEQIPQ